MSLVELRQNLSAESSAIYQRKRVLKSIGDLIGANSGLSVLVNTHFGRDSSPHVSVDEATWLDNKDIDR